MAATFGTASNNQLQSYLTHQERITKFLEKSIYFDQDLFVEFHCHDTWKTYTENREKILTPEKRFFFDVRAARFFIHRGEFDKIDTILDNIHTISTSDHELILLFLKAEMHLKQDNLSNALRLAQKGLRQVQEYLNPEIKMERIANATFQRMQRKVPCAQEQAIRINEWNMMEGLFKHTINNVAFRKKELRCNRCCLFFGISVVSAYFLRLFKF